MKRSERSPHLPYLSSSLAHDTAGVNRAVDSISRRIDRMVLAVNREDWMTVGKMGRRLARKARLDGYRAISAFAERVCAEARKNDNPLGVRRSMIRLLGAQGRIPHRSAR